MIYLPLKKFDRAAPGKGETEHGRKHAGDAGDLVEPDRFAKDDEGKHDGGNWRNRGEECGFGAAHPFCPRIPQQKSADGRHQRIIKDGGDSACGNVQCERRFENSGRDGGNDEADAGHQRRLRKRRNLRLQLLVQQDEQSLADDRQEDQCIAGERSSGRIRREGDRQHASRRKRHGQKQGTLRPFAKQQDGDCG